MNTPGNFHIVDHPLIKHKLSILRDKDTISKEFRELTSEITSLLLYQATKELTLSSYNIETPITQAIGYKIKLDNIVILPILRAGLGMVKGAQDLMPNARIGYIGMERDHKTHQPVDYYFKIPKVTDSMVFIVLDPMLATGGTMIAAIDRLKGLGAKNIVSICIISSPEGMNEICNHHQDVKIYTGALDKKLNNNKYIVPGLGDAGDRLYGTE
ncbi:MAG: uracil phosphoribosyltransferase [Candidatus Marinimicrobia bacterium]|jgi:uracil phosphoribosyltransferase|nr:uracil phosphoribosyltransferase [Candidatus Neomarinimicrobiota bacterium]|tara:strand:- start:277 stop:915 length:639 start_codon:yes stop_codon:yes gene_type:complete